MTDHVTIHERIMRGVGVWSTGSPRKITKLYGSSRILVKFLWKITATQPTTYVSLAGPLKRQGWTLLLDENFRIFCMSLAWNYQSHYTDKPMPQGRDTAVDYQPQAIKNTCIQSKSAA